MTEPVSIRFNNPGALNTAPWVKEMPGYLSQQETTMDNWTAQFDTPQHGVAAWYVLMTKYRTAGATTLEEIVKKYGGGQDYSAYVNFASKKSELSNSTVIDLNDDRQLLRFAKAMFWYEAGKPTPIPDEQIIQGFNLGRGKPMVIPYIPDPIQGAPLPEIPIIEANKGGIVLQLIRWLISLFKR